MFKEERQFGEEGEHSDATVPNASETSSCIFYALNPAVNRLTERIGDWAFGKIVVFEQRLLP